MIEYSIPATKTCTKCGREFPTTLEFFYREKRRRDGLGSWCKGCVTENNRAWYIRNKSRLLEYNHIYYVENKAQIISWQRVYRVTKKEEYASRGLTWSHTDRDVRRSHHANTKARKHNADGILTGTDIKLQYEAQNGLCYYCGVQVGDKYVIDHVVPFSRGGSNWPDNIVIACPTCNQRKFTKLPHEWLEGETLR